MFVACKATSVTTSSVEINEDLSIYRPEFASTEAYIKNEIDNEESVSQIGLTSSIKNEIDSISKIIVERNSEKDFYEGYTIQIYSGISREEAENARKTANIVFPELESSLTYYQPTYRVKIGAFRERIVANKYYNDVKKDFPRAILIPENIKKEKEEDDND